MTNVMVNGWLCRAARTALSMTRAELAEASGVTTGTIVNFEIGSTLPYDKTIRQIQSVFEARGIRFIDDNNELGFVRNRLDIQKDWPSSGPKNL